MNLINRSINKGCDSLSVVLTRLGCRQLATLGVQMKKIIPALLIVLISLPLLASEDDLTSTDLLIAQNWLSKNGGKQWKLLYDEIDGKKYQWVITKTIIGDEIHVYFKAGNEIDENGKKTGGLLMVSDQFFGLVIDKKSYKLKYVSVGG